MIILLLTSNRKIDLHFYITANQSTIVYRMFIHIFVIICMILRYSVADYYPHRVYLKQDLRELHDKYNQKIVQEYINQMHDKIFQSVIRAATDGESSIQFGCYSHNEQHHHSIININPSQFGLPIDDAELIRRVVAKILSVFPDINIHRAETKPAIFLSW